MHEIVVEDVGRSRWRGGDPDGHAGIAAFGAVTALALGLSTDGKTTRAGDVGFGIETDVGEAAAVIREHGGMVFWEPELLPGDVRRMAVGVTRDRHFFEIVEGADSPVNEDGDRR